MTGADLAAALALATGGSVHALPCDPRRPAFGVAIPPAGCAALVRDHGGALTVSVGQRAWPVTAGGSMPRDLPSEATRWAARHARMTTLTDAALALAPVLARELGEAWPVSIPGGQPAPSEMWLHPSGDRLRGAVGVFSGSIRVEPALVPMPPARELADACRAVVEHAREQLASYARNVTLSETCQQVAADLAAVLGMAWRVTGAPSPTYSAAVVASIVHGGREVVRVDAMRGQVWVDAGLPGEDGWHGTAVQATHAFEAVVRAVHAMATKVTYDTLDGSTSYLVLENLEGLKKGDIVTYGGPIDNHAPHVFTKASGQEVLVEEQALRRSVHRVLKPL